jgi:hypothetical protein
MEPELTPYQEGLLRQIGHFVDTVFAEQVRAVFVAGNNAEARIEAVKEETVRALEDHAQPRPEGFIYGDPDSRLSAVTCGCGDLLPVTRRSMVLDCWRRHVAERLAAASSVAPQPVIGIALQSVKAGEVFELYVNSNYFAAPQPEPAKCEHGQVKAHIYCPHNCNEATCYEWLRCTGPQPTS